MSARNILYDWYKTGAKPDGDQFKALIDSLFHRDEDTLSIDKVEGLLDLLINGAFRPFSVTTNANYMYTPPVGKLVTKIVIEAIAHNQTVSIGKNPGGNELSLEPITINAGNYFAVNCDAKEPIYIYGITQNINLNFYAI